MDKEDDSPSLELTIGVPFFSSSRKSGQELSFFGLIIG
jgi:hypothetical protein